MPAFLIQLAISAVALIIGYALLPKPKLPPPPELEDLEEPTADAGRPVPKVFGTMTVKGVNIIYFGDKNMRTREV